MSDPLLFGERDGSRVAINEAAESLLSPSEKDEAYSRDSELSAEPELMGALETTPGQMFFLFIRATIGPGCLSLPWAWSQAGTLLAPLTGALVFTLVVYNLHCLVKVAKLLNEQGYKSDSYAAVANEAYGWCGELIAKTCIIGLQFGICVVQMSFAGESLGALFPHLDSRINTTIVMVPMLLIALIKDLSKLTPFAIAGTISLFAAILMVIIVSSQELATREPIDLPLARWATLPVFFGSAVYSFESIGVVMAFRKSMGSQKDKFLPVADVVMVIVCFTYMLLGELAYLAYGEMETSSVIVFMALAFPGPWFKVADVCLIGSVILGFPLQLAPIINMVNEKFKLTQEHDAASMVVVRVMCVMCAYVAAMLVPHLGLVVSFVGCTGGTLMGMVFPALMDLKLRVPESKKARFGQTVGAVISAFFGILGTILGVVVVVQQVVALWDKKTKGGSA